MPVSGTPSRSTLPSEVATATKRIGAPDVAPGRVA
jgi:hypothetical protein